MVVGYGDMYQIPGASAGTFLQRNGWDMQGYRWLHYDYLLSRQALDRCTLIDQQWVNKG